MIDKRAALKIAILVLSIAIVSFLIHYYTNGSIVKAMMTDWYVSKLEVKSNQQYGYGIESGINYRFAVDKKYKENCVELGAHAYKSSVYQEVASYKITYPPNCEK